MTYKTYKLDVSGGIVSFSRSNLRELVRVIDYFVSSMIQLRLYE